MLNELGMYKWVYFLSPSAVQLAKTLEYADCISADRIRYLTPNEWPEYDTKPSVLKP